MKRWGDNNEWARLPDASPAVAIAVMRLALTNTAREAARRCLGDEDRILIWKWSLGSLLVYTVMRGMRVIE